MSSQCSHNRSREEELTIWSAGRILNIGSILRSPKLVYIKAYAAVTIKYEAEEYGCEHQR